MGVLAWKNYFAFFLTGGGIFGTIFFFSILVISQIFISTADYWMNKWAFTEAFDYAEKVRSYEALNGTNSSTTFSIPIYEGRWQYYYIYLGLILSGIVSVSIRSLTFYTICLRASKKLHYQMFNSVMSTSVRFFDLNPLGRIINRFSKDIGLLDEQIPWAVFDFLEVAMMIFSSIFITIFINFWIIIPLILLSIGFLYVRKYYLVTSIEIKRIDGINRSPILVHISNTVLGIFTIRAIKLHDTLYEEFNAQTDFHTRSVASYIYLTRWFGIRLDWIAACFTTISVFSCILLRDKLGIDQGQIGIMLVYLTHILPIFQVLTSQD